ncbi:MAG: hypothetical protein NXI22_03330 [bacterium]|nr:hypothetical protein [bacterium]
MLSTKTSHLALLAFAAAIPALLFGGCYGAPMPVNEADSNVNMPVEAPLPTDDGPPNDRVIRNVSSPGESSVEKIGD